MKYLLLLANAPDAWVDNDRGADDGVIEDWAAYTRALHSAGVLISGAGLSAPHSATSVRLRGGKRLLTDGPFADSKEHLIGYYLIECADLDEAIGWAAKVPNVRTGTVEVRPVSVGQTTRETLASLGIVVAT
jgi:hypothetical protein